MGKARLVQGNQACGLGALAAGVRFFAGYPITPSTEIAEMLAEALPKLGGCFIQMEDEIASMGAACGASLAGFKSLTATSGPGFSLKQELIGYAAMAEIPVVVVNVQRMGPATGLPTAPAQGDVMQARWGTHGDRGVVALSPGSVYECFVMMVKAVNFAEKFRLPVILLLDEVIGHMRERVVLPERYEIEVVSRKRPTVGGEDYAPYKPDADGVPPMAAFGDGYRCHVTGLVHDYGGMPASGPELTARLIRRLHGKLELARSEITLTKAEFLEDAEYVVIAYGGTSRAAIAAVKEARQRGIRAGLLRLITIWPFPALLVARVGLAARLVIVPEMNYGQLVGEVERYVPREKVLPLTKYDGQLFKPQEILRPMLTGGEQ